MRSKQNTSKVIHRQYLAHDHTDAKKLAVIGQERFVYKQTPRKQKRKNDFENAMGYTVDIATANMLPNKTPHTRRRIAQEAFGEYVEKKSKPIDGGEFIEYNICFSFHARYS